MKKVIHGELFTGNFCRIRSKNAEKSKFARFHFRFWQVFCFRFFSLTLLAQRRITSVLKFLVHFFYRFFSLSHQNTPNPLTNQAKLIIGSNCLNLRKCHQDVSENGIQIARYISVIQVRRRPSRMWKMCLQSTEN